MGRGIDATLDELAGGIFDLRIGFDGDIETKDTFDTAITVSLFSDSRADASQVKNPERRRGWIGNEYTPGFQIGSLLWTFDQTRLTRAVMNQIEDEARAALQWLVDDGLAVAISDVTVRSTAQGRVTLSLTIQRSASEVEFRLFTLWQNTGV